MNDTTSLRPASVDDLDLLLRVEQLVTTRHVTAAGAAAELARPDRRWLVAERGGHGVGAGCVADLAGDAHVLSLGVLAGHRGGGTGTALVAGLLRVATADLGCTRATLEVRASNGPARRLYRRCGFAEVGVRPGYYRDGEDAVVLWCDDPAAVASALTRTPETTA